MFYHNILHDDMRNGDGLRVVLFVSGCNHKCYNCQNPQTWDCNSGIEFDLAAKEEIFEQLNKDYISGITFSGGDPMHSNNLHEIYSLILEIRNKYPQKTIWLYTGFDFDELKKSNFSEDKFRMSIISLCDVLVDGRYVEELADVNYHWAGSTNQRIIDVNKSLEKGVAIRWQNN
jgi:anaerobic ribonucleoside-triphosphate reductase activating protein